MKSKLVLWGANAQDEKLMIAISLRVEDNKVDIYTFAESVATEDFYQKMMKEWRDGTDFEMPEHTHIERELSVTESLLPDDLKVERTDVVQRAQTEWHFLVLSAKLNQSYADRLEELKALVAKLEKYDQGVWDSLKEFWGKVQEQVRERNLVREHADKLRDNTNSLFTDMKALRAKMDEEFERISKDGHDKFIEALDEIGKKVESGTRLAPIFEELKNLQRQFKNTKLTRGHRNKIWEKLDGMFKEVKRRRFGDQATTEGNSPLQRIQRRHNGLINAINRMESSIRRDKSDLDYQRHKIETTSGQLEAQIRQAKLKMIEERVQSKEVKLEDMLKTKIELEGRIEKLTAQEARRKAEAEAKAKIAAKAKANAEVTKENAKKLAAAAEQISEGKKEAPKAKTEEPEKPVAAAEPVSEEEKEAPEAKPEETEGVETEEKKDDSVLGAISATLGESLTDVVDTVKAVASVVADKVEDAIEEVKEDLKEMVDNDDDDDKKEETKKEEASDPVAHAADIAAAIDE